LLTNVNAFSGRLSIAPFDDPRVPLQASVLEEQISEQVKLHPDWIGFVSWNKTSAKIDYLGPPEKSPFLVKNVYNPWNNQNLDNVNLNSYLQPIIPYAAASTPGLVLKVYNPLKGASGGGGTNGVTILKERSDYNLIQSSSTVNNIQVLNSMNSNNKNWIQIGTVYDSLQQFSSGATWKGVWQIWPVDTTCGTDTPSVNQAVSFNTWSKNDPLRSYISGTSTAGQYSMSVLDTLALTGSTLTKSISGDTGTNTINLGYQNPISGCAYPSGSMIEQWSSGSSAYDFVSDQYQYTFTLQSGSTTTTTTGFNGLHVVPSSITGVSDSTVTSPAGDTYSCSSSGNC
ncbi:MAG: hypothetical protein ACREAN_09295, partial [Nitrosopumilaceae archaeon]